MVAFARLQGLSRSLPPLGGALAGMVALAAFALMPADSLEAIVWNSGVAGLIPAAAPPLGLTAQAILALGSGVVVGAVVWSALFLLFGPGGFLARPARPADGFPVIRRADAHPDCPPRPPMTAADLGTPMMEISAPPRERPLPRDLDQPLAAFDPGAVLASPREPTQPLPPLVKNGLAPGERLDTFELDPPVAPTVAPQRREPPSQETIEALLRRLEESAGRRPRPSSNAA